MDTIVFLYRYSKDNKEYSQCLNIDILKVKTTNIIECNSIKGLQNVNIYIYIDNKIFKGIFCKYLNYVQTSSSASSEQLN